MKSNHIVNSGLYSAKEYTTLFLTLKVYITKKKALDKTGPIYVKNIQRMSSSNPQPSSLENCFGYFNSET